MAAQARATLSTQLQRELQKQVAELEELKATNSQMQTRLTIQRTSPAHFAGTSGQVALGQTGPSKKVAMQKARELERRLDEINKLEAEIEELAEEQEGLRQAVGKGHGNVDKARADMDGVFVTRQSQEALDRKVKILEGRLDQALVRFNRALDDNTKLRRDIEDLTRERLAFDSIYRELERELHAKKKKMACVIELSNLAYEERDTASNELAQLKVFAQDELRRFEECFRELDLILADDRQSRDDARRRLLEHQKAKSQAKPKTTRGGLHATGSSPSPLAATAGSGGGAGATTAGGGHGGDEDRHRKGRGVATDRVAALQQHEERFYMLRMKTGVSDVAQLVAKYQQQDTDNFSLFTFVNGLNNECERQEEQKAAALEAYNTARVQEGGDFSDAAARQRQIEKIQAETVAEEKALQLYRSKTEQVARMVDDLMLTIQKIFEGIGCSEETIVEQHGTAGVSETSVLIYLAAIEQQADRIIFQYLPSTDPSGRHAMPAGTIRGPAVPVGTVSTQLHIEPPSTGEDLHEVQSDDDDARVLTRAELQQRTQQRMAKLAALGGKQRRARPRVR